MYVGEGLTPRNLKLIRGLGKSALTHRVPFCIGGDWNNPPHALSDAVPSHILDGVVRGDECAPSYVLDDHSTTIDYFLIRRTLDAMVEKVKVMVDLPVDPHRPVKLTFKAESGDQKVGIAKKYQTPPGTR
eukprot:5393817-Pyramimonas_sp.AAC.1